MVTETGLKDAIYEQLVALVDAETDVSSPSDNVALLDNTSSVTYPFVGFRVFNQSSTRGVGDNSRITSIQRDADGAVTQVTRASTYRPRVEISVLARNVRERSELTVAVRELIDEWKLRPIQLDGDVRKVRERGTEEISRPDDRQVVGQRLSMLISYDRFNTFNVESIDDIDVTIEDADSDTVVATRNVY